MQVYSTLKEFSSVCIRGYWVTYEETHLKEWIERAIIVK